MKNYSEFCKEQAEKLLEIIDQHQGLMQWQKTWSVKANGGLPKGVNILMIIIVTFPQSCRKVTITIVFLFPRPKINLRIFDNSKFDFLFKQVFGKLNSRVNAQYGEILGATEEIARFNGRYSGE